MHLRKLVLRNFGLYRGEQTIDLAIRASHGKRRPIVLVGGNNGAGKTTLLDAVRLSLYGRLALGPRVTDTEYHAYLRERIHRRKEMVIPVTYASVAVEFDYAQAGRKATYFVQRAWELRTATTVNEVLRVLRDGEPLADVESQFWPDFVKELIPPGVSQLFFFDGERIKRLAEEESEAQALGESTKALLGLDLVERLQADLDLFSARHTKKSAEWAVTARLGEIEARQQELIRELEQGRTEERRLSQRMSEVGLEISRTEQLLAQRGGGLAAQRTELGQRRVELTAVQEQREKDLRDLCEGALPFALCPTLCQELEEQLAIEATHERHVATAAEVQQAITTIIGKLTRGGVPKRLGWDASMKRAVKSELSSVAEELLRLSPRTEGQSIHGLSERDRLHMRSILADACAMSSRIGGLCSELAATVSRLREVQNNLNRVPENDEIAPLIKDLSRLQEEHAKISIELTTKREELAKFDRELLTLSREQQHLVQKQDQDRALTRRVAQAVAARRALDVYLARLTEAKVKELEAVVLDCFQKLSRKDDLIHRLTINPVTFEVTLFDASDRQVPKSSLSAGEKQIYAVSLLWALARVSGRPLPMIIDTPLGRLDSAHRKNLLERYFPFASHQVVILSTDTEVDKAYFDLLRSHTSHSVYLENHSGGWTEASEGYFWDAVAHASA